MKNVDSINRSILDLWEKYCHPDDRPPLLYPPANERGILFVGANPSWTEGAIAKTYSSLKTGNSATEALITEEKAIRESHPYFTPCRIISKENKLPWDHVDWFFVRETNQKLLEKQVMERKAEWDAPVIPTPFGKEQITLAKLLMVACEPRIIIVINALASKIARTEFSLHDACLDRDGLYYAEISGKSTPVILSGMLTGQRALDKGSFERLKWQIRKTLSKTSPRN